MKREYTPTIGIEVHAELLTKTKMFCGSVNDPHNAEPNTHVCPVCLAHPGTLPVINKEAVKHVLRVGLALGSSLATFTEFDRKNYFYPDIPKGYQISQYQYPLVRGGELAGIAITRVHLEEDTARSLHDQGEGSIIDYNRAGVPLMELVTEPVIHDAKTAKDFARELQLLLRTLGVSNANMEQGEMRVEANISISKNEELGTKVEVKNLNSFKAVENAINYELERQQELLEKGESIVQETRGWDENKGKTFSQRIKEMSEDYRYFPEPDLPKLDISLIEELSLSRLGETMPELPDKKRKKYTELGLTREQVEVIILDQRLAGFFDLVLKEILAGKPHNKNIVKLAANYITSDVQALLSGSGKVELHADAAKTFVRLIHLVLSKDINSRVAKDILSDVVFGGKDPSDIASEKGLLQRSSEGELLPIVATIISEHPSIVDEYKSGKEASLQFLIGQGMKKTKGTANPEVLRELLVSEIVKR